MNIERTAELIKATGMDYKELAEDAGLSLSSVNLIHYQASKDMVVEKLKALSGVVSNKLRRSHREVFLEMAGFDERR